MRPDGDGVRITERAVPSAAQVLDVSEVTFRISDVDGAATALFDSESLAAATYITAEVSASTATIPVVNTSTFAASGVQLQLPSLNRPSFERLTYSGALDVVRETADAEPSARWDVVGSSMGGYIAARWAELQVGRSPARFPDASMPSESRRPRRDFRARGS
jgi:hypothetical protein